MRDPAVEDGEVSRGLEALTLGAVQPLGQVGAAQRRRNDHVFDDSGLGVPPVQTELIPHLGVSPHGQGANPTDRQHAREDVQREQSGPLSATSSNGHVSLGRRASRAEHPAPGAVVRARDCCVSVLLMVH